MRDNRCVWCGFPGHRSSQCKVPRVWFVVFLAGMLVTGPAPGVEITLTPAEQAQCDAEDGCHFMTKQKILVLLGMAERLGYEAGKKACMNAT